MVRIQNTDGLVNLLRKLVQADTRVHKSLNEESVFSHYVTVYAYLLLASMVYESIIIYNFSY
jgi:hypothetical protein